jgi:hypothetical protein
LGRDRAVLEGVLVNEAIEVLFQLARDFGWATGAYSIQQALGPSCAKRCTHLRRAEFAKWKVAETVEIW